MENNGVYEEPEEDGMWEESFSGTSDSKPKGPSAIAMDFTFVNTNDVYGIPEHADKFSLADTTSGYPYRYCGDLSNTSFITLSWPVFQVFLVQA